MGDDVRQLRQSGVNLVEQLIERIASARFVIARDARDIGIANRAEQRGGNAVLSGSVRALYSQR